MRVHVFDYTGRHANRPESGKLIYELIAPAIDKGESVELDFAGVEYISPLFLGHAVCALIPIGLGDRVDELLSATNLPDGPDYLREVIATHRRVKVNQQAYDDWQKYLEWKRWEWSREEE